jgi:hypothetical protein
MKNILLLVLFISISKNTIAGSVGPGEKMVSCQDPSITQEFSENGAIDSNSDRFTYTKDGDMSCRDTSCNNTSRWCYHPATRMEVTISTFEVTYVGDEGKYKDLPIEDIGDKLSYWFNLYENIKGNVDPSTVISLSTSGKATTINSFGSDTEALDKHVDSIVVDSMDPKFIKIPINYTFDISEPYIDLSPLAISISSGIENYMKKNNLDKIKIIGFRPVISEVKYDISISGDGYFNEYTESNLDENPENGVFNNIYSQNNALYNLLSGYGVDKENLANGRPFEIASGIKNEIKFCFDRRSLLSVRFDISSGKASYVESYPRGLEDKFYVFTNVFPGKNCREIVEGGFYKELEYQYPEGQEIYQFKS